MRFFGARIVVPVAVFCLYVYLLASLMPATLLRSWLFFAGLGLLVFWWGVHCIRWLSTRGAPQGFTYFAANLIVGFGIFSLASLSGMAVASATVNGAAILILGGAVTGVVWVLASGIHLIRTRRQHNHGSVFWRLLKSNAWIWRAGSPRSTEQAAQHPEVDVAGKAAQQGRSLAAAASGASLTGSQPANNLTSAESRSDTLYRPLWVDEERQPSEGAKIPVRPQPAQVPSLPAPQEMKTAPEPHPIGAPKAPIASHYFVAMAKKAANERGKRCEFTPFFQYWPTYSEMSPAQYRWYMYWRAELREGRVLPTDLSYLFVHIYELMNLVGVPDHVAAYRRLVWLWQSYRSAFPKLDNYMPDWIADFIVVQRLGIDMFDWYSFACQLGAASRFAPDLVLEMVASGHMSIEKLPADFVFRLSSYSPRQSKFYRTYAQELQLDTAYLVGLAAVDAAQRAATKKGLLQSHHSGRAYTLKRLPFASAMHGYQTEEISIAKIHPWSADPELGESVGKVLRHTENILRTQSKYRSQLRGVVVPAHWDAAINAVLAPKPVRKTVVIDQASVEALHAESEEVRRRLLAVDDEGAQIETPALPPTTAKPRREIPIDASLAALLAEQSEEVRQRLLAGAEGEDEVDLTAAGSKTTVSTRAAGHDYGGHVPHFPSVARPADASEGMLTDLPAVARILHSPDSEAWRLLRELRAQAWHAPAGSLAKLFHGGFASVAIDRLNECALEALGDSLLFEEGNEWVVADDYRDEVAYLLDHPQLLAGPEMAVTPTNTQEAPPAVDMAWQTFAAQLKPWHWQALAVLALDGANGSGPIKLDAIARAQLSTANQLIDEVNTIALDTIGDNVVDASGGAPAVFDEYTQPMRQLAQWAIECEKTEVIA